MAQQAFHEYRGGGVLRRRHCRQPADLGTALMLEVHGDVADGGVDDMDTVAMLLLFGAGDDDGGGSGAVGVPIAVLNMAEETCPNPCNSLKVLGCHTL